MNNKISEIVRRVSVMAIVLVTGVLTTVAFAQNTRPAENAKSVLAGKALYNKTCVFCHGAKGKGKGPVAYFLAGNMAPHPRDFTIGAYKFRSTASGDLPTDEDLFRTLTRGVPGFMPSYAGLSPQDRWKTVYYIKTLSPDFEEEKPEPISMGNPIATSTVSVRLGEKVYQEFKCWECHGMGGMGDGKKAADLKDDLNWKILPADLTMLNSLKNGSSKEDIYRSFMTGLNGTPMPSYADSIENKDDAWHLVNFILSLSGSN